MNGMHISLTDTEQDILSNIKLNANDIESPDDCKRNGDHVTRLMHSLLARDAIPGHRWKYWTDPEYNPGVQRSRKGIFEKNDRYGDEIYGNVHFLNHLKFLLYGPDLPDEIISEFSDKVVSFQPVTSGDYEPIGNYAKELIRRYRLIPDKHHRVDIADKFYHLCIEIDPWAGIEDYVRQTIMSMYVKQ